MEDITNYYIGYIILNGKPEQEQGQQQEGRYGQSDIVKFISELEKTNLEDFPHLLLTGSPGVGKTTLAHAISRDMDIWDNDPSKNDFQIHIFFLLLFLMIQGLNL